MSSNTSQSLSIERALRAPALVLFLAACMLLGAARANDLVPMTGVEQIALGESHACVLTDRGGVKCWGSNDFGQLGDGKNSTRYAPVSVVGLNEGVIALSAGFRHTCAVTEVGAVLCWGKNFLGQLGDGTTVNRTTPVHVVTLGSGVAEVAAGGDHTCARMNDSTLRCWGYNGYGQLGTGNTINQTEPVTVFGIAGAASVRAGNSNTCVRGQSGGVACWGVYNRSCNMFGCAFQANLYPTGVSGLGSGVQALSVGQYHQCALTTSGVKCWGDNYSGQLGNPENPDPNPFHLFDIDGLDSGVTAISAGYGHSCAVLDSGAIRCWGANQSGQIGDGSNAYRYPPVAVENLTDVGRVHAGGAFSCALNSASAVFCWGSNADGQLGDGDPWFRLEPVVVEGLDSGVTAISVGYFHNCAVLTGGQMRCWGANRFGQLGDGTFIERPKPVPVSLPTGSVAQVSTGTVHTCAVSSAGAASCWGRGERGRLGNGSAEDQPWPVDVSGLDSGVTEIDAGGMHSCARISTSTGAARCWGANIQAQLGDLSQSDQPTPVIPANLGHSTSSVSTGGWHSCAIGTDTAARCWGRNDSGQVGNGTTQIQYIPTVLEAPSQGVTQISLGEFHSCARSGNGQVHCWGQNGFGQLGLGFSGGPQTTAMPVQGLSSGASSLSAGRYHTCAVAVGGRAMCWGDNELGQIGDGSFSIQSSPVEVTGLGTGVVQIGAGDLHSCALTDAGAVKCWGSNGSGQLGIGRRNHRLPGPVLDDGIIFRSRFE